jgi:phytoene/squalene synthetase
MIKNYHDVSAEISKCITRKYSTSFSLGIYMLNRRIHIPIYGIYGFVRIADEIVDSFHGFDKKELLDKFEKETFSAIAEGISTNPVLHAFQLTVNKYQIEDALIQRFLDSMRMDLEQFTYNSEQLKRYIL